MFDFVVFGALLFFPLGGDSTGSGSLTRQDSRAGRMNGKESPPSKEISLSDLMPLLSLFPHLISVLSHAVLLPLRYKISIDFNISY